MAKDEIKAVLDGVLTWPAERQSDVAVFIAQIETQDRSPFGLTPEQAHEVRRRLADPLPPLPIDEVRRRIVRDTR